MVNSLDWPTEVTLRFGRPGRLGAARGLASSKVKVKVTLSPTGTTSRSSRDVRLGAAKVIVPVRNQQQIPRRIGRQRYFAAARTTDGWSRGRRLAMAASRSSTSPPVVNFVFVNFVIKRLYRVLPVRFLRRKRGDDPRCDPNLIMGAP